MKLLSGARKTLDVSPGMKGCRNVPAEPDHLGRNPPDTPGVRPWWISFLVLGCAALLGIGFYLTWYLQQSYEYRFLEILAPTEPALALPVYAQFTVTQRLQIADPIVLSRIDVPMYLARVDEPLIIDLRRFGRLAYRWRIDTHRFEHERRSIVPLTFEPPQLIDGELELAFAAVRIDHDHRDQAPRLFIETANGAYPHGNFRIAQNEKSGDVGLSLYALATHQNNFLDTFQHRPLTLVSTLFKWGLVAVLVFGVLRLAKNSADTMWYTSRRRS